MQLHTEKSSQFVGGRLWLGIRYRYVICQNELAPDRICGQHVCVRSPIQLEVLEDGGAYLTRIERVQAKRPAMPNHVEHMVGPVLLPSLRLDPLASTCAWRASSAMA